MEKHKIILTFYQKKIQFVSLKMKNINDARCYFQKSRENIPL